MDDNWEDVSDMVREKIDGDTFSIPCHVMGHSLFFDLVRRRKQLEKISYTIEG